MGIVLNESKLAEKLVSAFMVNIPEIRENLTYSLTHSLTSTLQSIRADYLSSIQSAVVDYLDTHTLEGRLCGVLPFTLRFRRTTATIHPSVPPTSNPPERT